MGCEGCGHLCRESSGREGTVLMICDAARLRAGEERRVLGEFPKGVRHTGVPRPAWCRRNDELASP